MIRFAVIALLAVSAVAQEFENGIGQREQVTKGLVAYWSMRNSGATVYDDRDANNGLISNTVSISYASGIVNAGASFQTTNGAIVIPDSASLRDITAGTLAISMWICPETAGGAGAGRPLTKGNWTIYAYSVSAGKCYLNFGQFFSSSGGNWTTTARDLVVNQWQHIVIIYNGSSTANNARMWRNGVEVGVTRDVAPSGTRLSDSGLDLLIGNTIALNRTWDGYVDEVRIYNVDLTLDTIKQLYRMGAAIYQNR